MSDAEGQTSKIPAIGLVDTLGVDKTTLHKWIERGKISDEYYVHQGDREDGAADVPRG